MRLKNIKLAGFKSFVDPTTIRLPSNLCSVVGPNGCGKSNVIDAVRWVLGEGSAKHLRGDSMADVIFNGSTGRKPLGQAGVELVFDNSDGKLGGEYAAFSEISVRRTVTRDGLSNYFLNGTRCRRRDITDIFLGTGLGPRSYAIIEQGMISRLIEAKPEELRIYIEEAAGISRYKERRKDTENRIRRTRENLERLTDLREELERQLQHLKRQASAAERYAELRAEERRTRAELSALEWRELESQGKALRQEIQERETALEAVHAKHTRVDAEITAARETHSEINDELSVVQERYYSLGAEIARTEQSVQLQQERSQQLSLDLEQTQRSHQEAARHLEDDERSLEEVGTELGEVEPALAAAEQEDREAQQALAALEQDMHSWQSRWDGFNHQAQEARQQVEVEQSRIRHLEEELLQASRRVEELEGEARELAPAPLEQDYERRKLHSGELESLCATRQHRVEEQQARIEAARGELDGAARELDELRDQMRELRGRLTSLNALQQAALGQTEGEGNDWLRERGLDRQQRLAQCLRVENGWETAVETVLGGYLQAVCVPQLESFAAQLEHFDGGTVTLFATTESGPTGAHDAHSLLAKVDCAGNLGAMLGSVYAVEHLHQALALRNGLGSGESVVTRDGIWVGANWVRVAREKDPRAGVLRRAREISVVESMIELRRQRELGISRILETSRLALGSGEETMGVAQRELQEANRQYTEARAVLGASATRLEQVRLRLERNRAEQQRYRERCERHLEAVRQARGVLQGALDSMQRDSEQREHLLRERDGLRESLDACRQRARHGREAAHQLAMRRQSLSTRRDSLSAAIGRIGGQFAQLSDRSEQLSQQIAAAREPIAEGRRKLQDQLQSRLGVEAELTTVRQRIQAVEHELREAERRRHEIEQEAEVARDALERQRLASQTVQVRQDTILEQLRSAGFEAAQLVEELPVDAVLQDWQSQLDRLANQIQRLGPINLAAIDEHRVQSERKTYLDRQNEDLVAALETLENAIRRIDRETRTRFKDTFDRVNSGLQELFPRVFGGGHAYLELTGEDLLDTGVTIMARPPGKRNATIHLLSGGEKALTAIAMVFSIFRLNPSPFCMLDEVDAPLDDVNVGRFARLVREMSEQVQFIVITHNKITMEMAHHLMGVTMQEPGVSRLVSVDVDEAVALAESG